MHYRIEIDGLRAFAILPVVLSHAWGGIFSGGYVGVDIFFVISGYLITSTIIKDHGGAGFSLLAFYERRIRRILPALFAVLLVSLAVGLFLLAPVDYAILGREVFAACLFVSNMLYFRQAGYFDPGGDLKPLLHTWSLAVEEQFYLAFPILLAFLLRRYGMLRSAKTMAVLAGLSFALCVACASIAPTFNYFSAATRAWELLIGAAIALAPPNFGTRQRLKEALALLGLALILLPVFLYDESTPFPGIAALPPVLGSCLILAAAQHTRIGGWLSIPPLRAIGLISYSLYLWHWPVLVFWRFAKLDTLTSLDCVLAVVVSFVAAALSYRFVERPFRDRKRIKRRGIFLFGVIGSLALALLGAGLSVSGGLAFRTLPNPLIAAAERDAAAFQADPCLRRGAEPADPGLCVLGAPDARLPVTAALWGDSHAAQLVPAVDSVGRQLGVRIDRFTKAGCPPMTADRFWPPNDFLGACPAFNDAVMGRIAATPTLRTLIVALRWDAIASGGTLASSQGSPNTAEATQQLLVRHLLRVADMMRRRGGHLILISQIPIPPFDPMVCAREAAFRSGRLNACRNFDSGALDRMEQEVDRTMIEPLRAAGITIIDAHDLLCANRRCAAMSGDRLLYFDPNHLSPQGASLFEAPLRAAALVAP